MESETTVDQDPDHAPASQGGGSPGFAGYLYQVDVSVWAALDLVLAKGVAPSVELEPCSQEDIEAEARLPLTDPGRAGVATSIETYHLVIQAKLRSGEPWKTSSLAALLNHGSNERVSARRRLDDSDTRYLLVTSAPLTGLALGLRIRGFGGRPMSNQLPASLARILPADAAGRVGVMPNVDEEHIAREVKDLLTEAFLVPKIKWESCFEELRKIARAKMTGPLTRRWTREEMKQTIESFDGYLASSPELTRYVHPSNWRELCGLLEEQHAIVIAGKSGTGKTMTAEALWDHMRRRVPGLERVHVTGGPDQVRSAERTTPVLFEIEDPWGRYRFMPDARPWNDSLSSILQTARPDRLFIVTTRNDVLHDALADKTVSPWRVSLEAEHYGRRERAKLFQNRVVTLPRNLQVIATDYRDLVLRELETPFELQKFFDMLRSGVPAMPTEKYVKQVIKDAHHESIEKTLDAQISERGCTHWAVVLWGLLKANPKLPRALVPDVQERLSEHGREFESGFEQLLNFLVAGRSLRQAGSMLNYYHPRVEAALEGILRREPLTARRVLRVLSDALVSFDDQPQKDWGRTATANVTKAAVAIKELKFSLEKETQSMLDNWLPTLLLRRDNSFDSGLLLVARAGSPNCACAELARFLIDEMPEKWLTFDPNPETVAHGESWYRRVAADPTSRSICDFFVRHVLPADHRHYPETLADQLTRLAGDLSDAFVNAALSIVRHGVNSNAGAIGTGAVKNLEAFAPVVDAALTAYADPTAAAAWQETSLAITNGEYSEDYAEHLAEQASEDGYTASELLKTYVEAVRREKGWSVLREHPRVADLLRWWLDVAKDDPVTPPMTTSEIAAVGDLALNTRFEGTLWVYLSKHWHPKFESALLARLIDGHADTDILGAAVACLLAQIPQRFSYVCQKLLDLGAPTRVLQIFADLDQLPRHLRLPEHKAETLRKIALDWMQSVPLPLRELVSPFTLDGSMRNWKLSDQAIPIAQALEPTNDAVLRAKIRFGLANGFPVDRETDELLASTQDQQAAVFALEGATATGRVDIVERSLHHQFAKVRAAALRAFASRHPGLLPHAILAMSQDRGKYVREALVEVLAERPIRDHLTTLAALTGDRWSPWTGDPGRGEVEYPIALAAARALYRYRSIPARIASTLIETAKSSEDNQVSATLLAALAAKSRRPTHEALFDLALSPGRIEIRVAAAVALLSSARRLDNRLLSTIQPQHLITLPAKVSAALIALVGLRGSESEVRVVADLLVHTPARKVFLVILATATSQQNSALADSAARLLPNQHIGIAIALSDTEEQFPRSALDDLGDVPAVRAVLWLLHKRFVKAR